jgi:hypothetical protein
MTCQSALKTKIVFLKASVHSIVVFAVLIAFPAPAQQTSSRQPLPQSSAYPLFLPAVLYSSGGSGASAVAIVDVNGDGKPDLIVANNCADNGCPNGAVGVLLGNGDGTFQPAVAYATGGESNGEISSVAVADLNGDGKPDVVVTNSAGESNGDGSVAVLLGNGDGTFRAAVAYDSGGEIAHSVAVADVNKDGFPDLVVANQLICAGGTDYCDTGNVAVILGNGDGTFRPAATYYGGGEGPTSVAVADVNGDGTPDLVVANCGGCGSSFVGVLLGNGDGTFQPAVSYPAGIEPLSVVVADINGDGNPDVIVADACFSGDCSNGGVAVLLGNGDGSFQPMASYSSGGEHSSITRQGYAFSVAVANINGEPDLLVADSCFTPRCTSGAVGVLLGNGDGTFQPAVTYSSGGAASWIAVADVNGDGRSDVLVAGGDTVSVMLNNVPSKTAVATSGSPSFVGQPVKFTASVTSVYGTVPSGELVTFYDGHSAIGTGTTADGAAALTTSSLRAGTHEIKAVYAGDRTFAPSSGRVKQIVNKYTTTTVLISSPNPSAYGQAVTFTVTVASSGANTPTGHVVLKDGTTSIGQLTLSSGVAEISKSKLAVGSHSITAEYEGDTGSAGSMSPVLNQVVSQN